MEGIGLLTGLTVFVVLIVFFIMAAALGNISRNIKEINSVLKSWGVEKGYGITYKCDACDKTYIGKLPRCPDCGAEKVY